jgi:DNA modification methylase
MFTKQITGKYPSQNGWFDTSGDHKLTVPLKDHGAGMPVTVAERGIYWHSLPNGCVLEPFSGTGTTIIAAEMSGRACHAIELNPEYVDIAVKRWEAFTGREAIHEQRIQTDARAAQAG